METTRLIDPAFWASDAPAFPGVEPPAWSGEAPGLVWFRTSGSTGSPRWIGLSRESLLLSAAVVNRHLGVRDDEAWGLALPLRHVGGFGVVARAFEAGAPLERFSSAWEPVAFTRWVDAAEVAHLSLVPTQVHDLLEAGCEAPPALRTVVVGGGVLKDEAGQRARDLGWPVLPSYGMTEAGSQIATPPPEVLSTPYGSGPLPVLPHWEVSCDADGRIHLRGRSLFDCEARETEQGVNFERRSGDRHATGDRGRLVDGGLEVLGRLDSVVKVLGELVDPVAIERDLGVDGAVVVAVPEERRGHRLLVVVEAEVSDIGEAIESYNRRAEGPRRVEGPVRVDEIPRSELGKVRRIELAARLSSGAR